MKIRTLTLMLFLTTSMIFAQKINWKTMEEADKIQKKNPEKRIFVDVYTTWCGPCKMLDQYTFSNVEFSKFINDNYIPVKLDAEHKAIIKFKGNKFKFIPVGRSGYNELAYYILDGRLSFPSMVVLDSKMQVEGIITGFRQAPEILQELKSLIKK